MRRFEFKPKEGGQRKKILSNKKVLNFLLFDVWLSRSGRSDNNLIIIIITCFLLTMKRVF